MTFKDLWDRQIKDVKAVDDAVKKYIGQNFAPMQIKCLKAIRDVLEDQKKSYVAQYSNYNYRSLGFLLASKRSRVLRKSK